MRRKHMREIGERPKKKNKNKKKDASKVRVEFVVQYLAGPVSV